MKPLFKDVSKPVFINKSALRANALSVRPSKLLFLTQSLAPPLPVLHIGRRFVGSVRSVKPGVLQRLEGVLQRRQHLRLGFVSLVLVRNILDDGGTNLSLTTFPVGQLAPDVVLASDGCVNQPGSRSVEKKVRINDLSWNILGQEANI